MTQQEALYQYILQIADNSLILGQRLSEWCGHGPVLEQDIALTNVALDLMGQARFLLDYAAKIEDKGRNEDQVAFLRLPTEYRNSLLVEQPNIDFAYTIMRQFFFDAFHYQLQTELLESADSTLAALAEKSIKEVAYHLKYSSEWVIRLGDGTDVSHQKVQAALNDLWMYTEELIKPNIIDERMVEAKIGVDLNKIKPAYLSRVNEILNLATLTAPENSWMQSGGKDGRHSEHLGFILAEMQYMQRTYPNLQW